MAEHEEPRQPEPPDAPGRAVTRRGVTVPADRQPPRRLPVLRSVTPSLPAVVGATAAATVATGLLAAVARRLLAAAGGRPVQVQLSGIVVHQVHVVHHHVVHRLDAADRLPVRR